MYQLLINNFTAYGFSVSQRKAFGIWPDTLSVWGVKLSVAERICNAEADFWDSLSGNLDDFRCVGSYAEKGLIDRVINREDRREVRVVPTEKGKQLQEPITEIIDEVNEEVLKCFTEEEVNALKNALRIIADGSHFK